MYIEFHSDASFVAGGFEAQWTSTLKKMAPPIASFTSASDTIYESQSLSFQGTAIGNDVKYLWDFNGDGINDATGPSPTYVYKFAGVYMARLVASNCGGNDTFKKKILVIKPTGFPLANFTTSYTNYYEGDIVHFTDITTNHPYYWNWIVFPAVTGQRYNFVYGTGYYSQHPQIQFLDTGYYTIRLEVANSRGNSATVKTKYIHIGSYCKPDVTKFNQDVGISKVVLTDISNDIIDQSSASGTQAYNVYSMPKDVRLDVGGAYRIEIQRPTAFNKVKGRVWVDFNIDGDFDDAGEEIISQNNINGKTWGDSFTIGKNLTKGISRMRIGTTYNTSPINACGNNSFGEFEDYTVALSPDDLAPAI
ncbi:MAG TPA: GEVED domain-containing protein, partial [Niastella sp.]|nr:GEVED domain-containing protein [Niastella sp.]